MDPQDAARVAPRGARLAPEACGVGGVAERERIGVEDLVAMEVRHRDLGGGNQIQVVARRDVHLVLLVRDLPGAARRVGIDEDRRPDLGHAVLVGVDVEEPADQRALEVRAIADVDRPAGARDLGAARVVDQAEVLGDLPVRATRPRAVLGIRVVDAKERLPHLAHDDVRLLAADRHVGVGRVRDAQHGVVELGLDRLELRLELRDALADTARRLLELGDLAAVRVGAAANDLADAAAGVVALRLEGVGRGEQRAPALVELDRAIDDGRILALVRGAAPERVGVVAEALQADAHAATAPAASRSRSRTKERSSAASSQPARGPEVRPRKAR